MIKVNVLGQEWITLQFDKIHQTYIELGLYHDTVDVTTLGGE